MRNHYDFSRLSEVTQQEMIKEHVSKTLEIKSFPNKARLQFGYVSFKDQDQNIKSICGVYTTIVFTFEAEGEAINGEKPQLKVASPCKENGLISAGEVNIPLDSLAALPPADGDLQLFEPEALSFTFKNIGEQWPSKWNLTNVQLKNTDRQIIIQENELLAKEARSITFQ